MENHLLVFYQLGPMSPPCFQSLFFLLNSDVCNARQVAIMVSESIYIGEEGDDVEA